MLDSLNTAYVQFMLMLMELVNILSEELKHLYSKTACYNLIGMNCIKNHGCLVHFYCIVN